jgi:membrane-associated phospholipid phosphatase
VLTVAAATTGLVIADQYDAGYFRRATSLNSFNSAFFSTNTAAGILLAPVAFYSAGYFSKDDYAKQTALLSAESALDGEIVDVVLKLISDRRRPSAIPKTSNFADSFVEGKNHFNGSFPSAHTIAAFSVATVVSRRYAPRHKWVPVVAYGLSAAIGFSRISASAHFPSDVFLGAALGYSIGRFAVLHQ